jgi:DNA-binding response OmpR family regulator
MCEGVLMAGRIQADSRQNEKWELQRLGSGRSKSKDWRAATPEIKGDMQVAKILCVDTDKHFGSYVCAHLKDAGHSCMLDSRGDRVIRMIEQHSIDLVIAEVMLPDVCGFEICRRIRAHAELFTLPVILMSSMASQSEITHGLAQGADDYLAKPFDTKTLVSRVNDQLKSAYHAAEPDSVTGLSSAKMIKAVIQRNITQKIPFATAYIEMDNIAEFGKFAGDAPRDKALRHIARILDRYGKLLDSPRFHTAHMGLGHFVCVMEPDNVVPYCERVADSWEKHLPDFYELVGLKMPKTAVAIASSRAVPLLSLVICVTNSDLSGADSVKEYFDVLAQLRKKAVAQGGAGIHLDHRKAQKKRQAAS